MRYTTDFNEPGRCRECGLWLVRTARATHSSPEEWGCPSCDGGHDCGEQRQMELFPARLVVVERYWEARR
jgi:hypothetical protein